MMFFRNSSFMINIRMNGTVVVSGIYVIHEGDYITLSEQSEIYN